MLSMITDPQALNGSPGEVLKRLFMDPLKLSAYRVSTDLEVAPIAISEILRGKRAISPSMALRLGTYFGVSPEFWLALQAAHDLQRTIATDGSNGAAGPNHTVTRCAALDGREFVVQESKSATARHWQVLMTTRKAKSNGESARRGTPTKAPPAHTAKKALGGKNGKKGR